MCTILIPVHSVIVVWSPTMSLWPLGRFCSWLRMVTFLPMRLSVILLLQSRGFDDGVLYLGVLDGGVVSDTRLGAMCVRADLYMVSPAYAL